MRHYITLAVSSDKLREVLMRFPKLGVGRCKLDPGLIKHHRAFTKFWL